MTELAKITKAKPAGKDPKLSKFNYENGYYRVTQAHSDEYYRNKGFVEGTCVFVSAKKTRLEVIFPSKLEWHYEYEKPEEMDEFHAYYEFLPNGAQEIQKSVNQLIEEVSNTTDFSQIGNQLASFNPLALPQLIVGEAADNPASKELATKSLATLKKSIAGHRNEIMRTQKQMMAKVEKLQGILDLQSKVLENKTAELQEILDDASRAIWTINLYLGRDEQIHTLAAGKPAPVETKISLRQKILFMDEECAIIGNHGGIDVNELDKFDEWVIKPKNLQQVLPEPKGIVALHPRHKPKNYGEDSDPWVTANLNKANSEMTCFLIRNGENVYRVYIDIVLDKHLFPTASEFEDIFSRDGEPLQPGSKEYYDRMDSIDDTNRHYMRVALVLQGLLDRTKILHPIPTDRINVCDPIASEPFIDYIYDAEKLITDGRPDFDKWQKELNSKIDIGMRLIGNFGYKLYGNPKEYERSRITPSNACLPSDKELHTIVRTEKAGKYDDGQRYYFLYKREGDYVYSSARSRRRYYDNDTTPMTRANCYVFKRDKFILAFDAATLEELEYYAHVRTSRHLYEEMIPVLEVAIALKKKEAKEEAPFRLLLIGEIVKTGVSQLDAEAKVDELIKWWKYKNRTHKALTSDDKLAIKQIVAEYGLVIKKEQTRAKTQAFNDSIVKRLLNQPCPPVYVAHKTGNKYVAYVPHNDQNIWVKEQIWAHNRQTDDLSLKSELNWKLVDNRHQRWKQLYKDDRWDSWKINPRIATVLTDEELQFVVETSLKDLKNFKQQRRYSSGKADRFLPLGVYVNDKFDIIIWHSHTKPKIPKLLASGILAYPTFNKTEITWKRTPNGIITKLDDTSEHTYLAVSFDESIEKKDSHSWHTYVAEPPHDGYRVVKEWPENFTQMVNETKQLRQLFEKESQIKNRYNYVIGLIEKADEQIQITEERAKYDAEFGAPDLWEDHLQAVKKKVIKDRLPTYILSNIFILCAERNIELVGKSLRDVAKLGAKFKTKDLKEFNKAPFPWDFVIPPKPIDEETE